MGILEKNESGDSVNFGYENFKNELKTFVKFWNFGYGSFRKNECGTL